MWWKSHERVNAWPIKRQPHKMVKHTRTTRRQFADDSFSLFDHFVGLALKELSRKLYAWYTPIYSSQKTTTTTPANQFTCKFLVRNLCRNRLILRDFLVIARKLLPRLLSKDCQFFIVSNIILLLAFVFQLS